MAPAFPARAGSLSLRLLAFAGAAIAVDLALAWAVLGTLFERHAERKALIVARNSLQRS